MTKKEFLKLYEGKAVWCKTEELANEFLELADKFGFNGEKFVSVAKDEQFDKEKGVLMCLAKANGFDYKKVSELVTNAKKHMPKLTEAERIILENLPKEWKWIARDECKTIFVYKDKPSKSIACWRAFFTQIPFSHLFQFIKWSDDEPYEIEKLLERK